MTENFIQTDKYTVAISVITGRTIFRNDDDSRYLLSPEFSVEKTRQACNQMFADWSEKDNWPLLDGTIYQAAINSLRELQSKDDFIDCFNGLIQLLNNSPKEDATLLMRTGLRRRFIELTSCLWEAAQIAAPILPVLKNRTNIDIKSIKVGGNNSWIFEIKEASRSAHTMMQNRSTIDAWRLSMTAIGIQDIGDLTPDTVRKDAFTHPRGSLFRIVQPLLVLQRLKYGDKVALTEHDWGVGRAKPKVSSDFPWAVKEDSTLAEWHQLFTDWLERSIIGGIAPKGDAVSAFLRYLIAEPQITRNPLEYVSRKYHPSIKFEEWVDAQPFGESTSTKRIGQITGFFDWYVDTKLALEDDLGRPVRNPELYNPITRRRESRKNAETAREAIPIRYLRELVHIIRDNDFAWAKSFKEDFIKRLNTQTGTWERTWNPVRAYAMLMKLYLPLRTYQVCMLDSGEADSEIYQDGQWITNTGALKPKGKRVIQRGFVRKFRDHNTATSFTGFFVNTNKTADRFKDLTYKGYEIPWQHDEVIALYVFLRGWQEKYNPLKVATKWSDLHMPYVIRSQTKAQLAARGESCFLFRDACRSRPEYPVDISRMQNYWYRLLDELERRVAKRGETLPNGQPIRFIEKRGPTGLPLVPVFDLHSLRVSILTALSVEGGLPLSILSKCVAGHATILMTLYYLKQGPAYISQQMAEAQAKMMAREQENYLRFIQDCDIAAAESAVAFNDQIGLRALQDRTTAGWIIGDLGICPVGGAMCHVGGPKLTGENGRNDYQPTLGGPRNCIRCRYFLTGPAFLAGLVANFNSIGMDLLDCSELLRKMQADISQIEDELFAGEAEDQNAYRRLDTLYHRREQAMNRLDDVAHNWHATFAMVERSKSLLASNHSDGVSPGGIRLLASEDLSEVATFLGQSTPFDLYNSICQHATVYPVANTPVASLRRGRLLDAMLARNDRRPVFAVLSEEEAVAVGNEVVNFLYARLGVIESNRLIEGTRMLAAAGVADEMDSMLTSRLGTPVKLASLIVQHEKEETHILGLGDVG
jgi:hypothetical protein